MGLNPPKHGAKKASRARLARDARQSSTPKRMSNALFLRLLDQLLGPYIADLSRDKLHGVGVWSGSIVLHNLALREEALDGCKDRHSNHARLRLHPRPRGFQ